MDFGSNFAFVPSTAKEEYELVAESVFNHTVVGYASTSADYKDDGEVFYRINLHYICVNAPSLALRHVCWIYWTQLDKKNTHLCEIR